jgi:hypothetical protein
MKKIQHLLIVIVSFALVPVTFAGDTTFDNIVKLIEAGKLVELGSALEANPEAVNQNNEDDLPLIHHAAMTDNPEVVGVLLNAGANLNMKDSMGRTPLHLAAGWSTVEMVELMWSRGADPSAKTKNGDTPLDFATDNFYEDKKVERAKIVSFLKGRGAAMSEGGKVRQTAIKDYDEELAARPDKGPEPEQSEWDSSVPIVKDFVKATTKDPSPKFREWSKVSPLGDRWLVRAKFDYKNEYGVTRQMNLLFYIRDGKVIGTKQAQ